MMMATLMMLSTLILVALVLSEHLPPINYGTDCSFPHFRKVSSCGTLLGNRSSVYFEYMEGCRQRYGDACDDFEEARLRKNKRKPQSMFNYTSTGFQKSRAPQLVSNLLQRHWQTHKAEEETWRRGDTRANHWVAPTYMVSLYSAGHDLVNEIYMLLKPLVEQWTGMEQRPVSLYGIRVYARGAILAPHVDRYPLVSSVIINVAQEMEEPWPLE